MYSPRNAEVVREQILQADDLFKTVPEGHREYVLLPVEQPDKDEDWFHVIDASVLQFKENIHGWIRDVERERDAAKLEAKSKRSSVSGSVSSNRSSRHSSVHFLEERQTAEFKAKKVKV